MSATPEKAVLAVLLSMAACIPMFAWPILGATGHPGDLYGTLTYEVVKYVLIGLTMVFYFVVSPFVIWPRLFGSCTCSCILRRGRGASGRIVLVGEKGREHVSFRGRPHTYLETGVEVREGADTWTVSHLALVPDDKVGSVRAGMEVPGRICPDDRKNIAVEWDRVATWAIFSRTYTEVCVDSSSANLLMTPCSLLCRVWWLLPSRVTRKRMSMVGPEGEAAAPLRTTRSSFITPRGMLRRVL